MLSSLSPKKRREIDLLPLFPSIVSLLIDFCITGAERKTRTWPNFVTCDRQDRGSSSPYVSNKHNRKRRECLPKAVNSMMVTEFEAF